MSHDDDDDGTIELYTVKDVARLFGLQEARLRYWHQTGFVGPTKKRAGRAYYAFEDLISVKAARELLDGGLSLQKVRKLLDALRNALPHVDRPLGQLRVCADGDELVVVGDDAAWQPASGQLVMSFAVSGLTREIAEVLELTSQAAAPPRRAEPDAPPAVAVEPEAPARAEPPPSAYAAFLEGLRAEHDGDRTLAEQLYRKAVAKDDGFSAAWTNLGNVLEATGERPAARAAYERALGLDPDQPEARFNLANLLSDEGELDLALAEYRRVIAACPDFADACFNAALVCERLGRRQEMTQRLERYLELDPDSPWADEARKLLAELAGTRAATPTPFAIETEATTPA